MAIAYGGRAGSNHGNTNGASETVTTTVSIPAGALIVVSVSGSNVGDTSNLASITDSAGNTYASGGFTVDPGQNTLTAVWYSKSGNALGSGGTVTVNFNVALLSSGESWEIAVDWLTGADMTTPTDGTQSKNSQTGGTWNTGTGLTTTNAADLLWVAAGTNQGAPVTLTNAASTPNSGWTTLAAVSGGAGNNNQLQCAYNVVAATGTYIGGGTASAGNNGTSAVLVAFKAASGGGSTPITLSDSATGTDSESITASVPLSDSGVGTDTSLAITAQVPLTESGAGAEALAVIASMSLSDSATAADSLSVTQINPKTLSDSATASDSLSVAQIVPISLNDAGVGTDSLAGVNVSVPLTDLGAAIEAIIIAASLALSDSGVGVETLSVPGISKVGAGTVTDAALASANLSDASVGTSTPKDAQLATVTIGDL